MTYLTLSVALVGSLVALTGPSWNKDKPGKLKFTGRGWLSLLIIIIGFSTSLISTYRNSIKANLEAKHRAEVISIARDEIRQAIARFSDPFIQLLVDNGELDSISGKHYLEYQTSSLRILKSRSVINKFTGYTLFEMPKSDISGFEYDSYAEAIAVHSIKYPKKLDEIFRIYISYLPPEDLVSIRSVIDHTFLTELNFIDSQVSQANFEFFEEEDYIDFFTQVYTLYSLDN